MDREDIKWVNKMALPALAGTFVETIFSVADQAIIGRTSMEGYAALLCSAGAVILIGGWDYPIFYLELDILLNTLIP